MKTLEQITERLEAAYSSTWAYCTEKLRLTNSSAHRRIRAHRLMRRFPIIVEYIRAGRVSLAKLAMLEEVLDAENCVELLDDAENMTEYEVKVLVAELRPSSTFVPEVKLTPLTRELTEIRMVVDMAWPLPPAARPAASGLLDRASPVAAPPGPRHRPPPPAARTDRSARARARVRKTCDVSWEEPWPRRSPASAASSRSCPRCWWSTPPWSRLPR